MSDAKRAEALIDEVIAEFVSDAKASGEPTDAAEAMFKRRALGFLASGARQVARGNVDREDAWTDDAKRTLTALVGWGADNSVGSAAGWRGYGKLANAWLSLGWPHIEKLEDEPDDEDWDGWEHSET